MENYKPQLPETPITNSLSPENKEWVEGNFPLTNDDNLREHYALKIITDSDFLDKLRAKHESGEKLQNEIYEILWDMYADQLRLGHYVNIQNDLKKKTGKLIDELRMLKTRKEIESKFKLQKSDISRDEILNFNEERIKDIENELFNISTQEVTQGGSEKLINDYSRIINKYNHYYTMFYGEDFNPENN